MTKNTQAIHTADKISHNTAENHLDQFAQIHRKFIDLNPAAGT